MKRDISLRITLMVILLLLLIPVRKAEGIPAFARKYQISCQVCHAPAVPRLKGFGDQFAADGYRMVAYESPRYYVPTGDDKLSLFRELPLAVRIDGFVTYNFDDQRKLDFASPLVMKILSGGELSDKLSYYFYFLLNEGGSIVGIEDAFLIYNNLFNTGMNFYIGQFQASDPMFKNETRFTLEPYQIYAVRPGNSLISLKYERGIMLEKKFSSGTGVLAEVVNGSGLGEAGEALVFDTDRHKNFLFRLSQEFGSKLLIGVIAYTGREDLTGHFEMFENDVFMYGPDLRLNLDDKVILNLQYIRRMDSEVFLPQFNNRIHDVITRGGFAEIIFSPKGDMSNWYMTGLLNWIESDLNDLGYKAATLHAGYLVRRNVRLVTEYTSIFSGNPYGKISVGFVTAF